jgi:hypothetical protein
MPKRRFDHRRSGILRANNKLVRTICIQKIYIVMKHRDCHYAGDLSTEMIRPSIPKGFLEDNGKFQFARDLRKTSFV